MQLSIESYQKSHFQEQCNHTEGKISTFLTHTDAFYLKFTFYLVKFKVYS